MLGAILLRNECLATLDLAADDFYHPQRRIMFAKMRKLSEAAQPIDAVTLDIGGETDAVEASECVSHVPTADNIEHYAGIVREKAAQRRLMMAASEILTRGSDEPGEDFLEFGARRIYEVTQSKSGIGPRPIKDILRETMKTLGDAADGKVLAVKTGFPELDLMLGGGMRAPDLVVLAARPACGKTALAVCAAINVAFDGLHTVIFSLEMASTQLAERMLASEAMVDMSAVRRGSVSRGEMSNIAAAHNRLSDIPIMIDDSAALSLQDVVIRARRWAVVIKTPGLVVVDYLQLLKVRGMPRGSSREQEVAEISRGLKQLAKELSCPVLALAQLNRGVEQREDKRPLLSDLRESGGIEQDADVVMFIYRGEIYGQGPAGEAEILIRKARNGATGDVKLVFGAQFTKFTSVKKKDYGF